MWFLCLAEDSLETSTGFLQEPNFWGSLMTPCMKYMGSWGNFRGSYFHGGCLQVFHTEAIIINNIQCSLLELPLCSRSEVKTLGKHLWMNYSCLTRLIFTINFLYSTYKYNHTVKRFYLITYTEKNRAETTRCKRGEPKRSVTYLTAFVFSYTVVQASELSDRRCSIYFGTCFEKGIVGLALSVMLSSCFHIEQSAILILKRL